MVNGYGSTKPEKVPKTGKKPEKVPNRKRFQELNDIHMSFSSWNLFFLSSWNLFFLYPTFALFVVEGHFVP